MKPESQAQNLMDMDYQTTLPGTQVPRLCGQTKLKKEKNGIETIAAVENQDFNQAAIEMKDSRWYSQVGKRAETLINMMKQA